MSAPLIRPDDNPAMREAIATLRRERIFVTRPAGSSHQLKIGSFSYYPGRGTIYRDGEISARQEKGLLAFLRLLRKAGLAGADKPIQPVDDPTGFVVDLGDEDDEFQTR